jgi:CRP-like cAMP-binding protein
LSSNGKDQIVCFLKEGALLGYHSVIGQEAASLTVTAFDDMQACFISKNKIFEMIKSSASFSLDIFKAVCHDLKEANSAITDMAQKSVCERLVDTL